MKKWLQIAIVSTVPVAKTGWTAPQHVLNGEVYAAIYLPQTLNLMMTVTIHLHVEDIHTEAVHTHMILHISYICTTTKTVFFELPVIANHVSS